ncbi:Mis12-Mtw1 protein family-domain-containing protein [Mrakia frigida]|uniref:Mis12-Mtw1 protein family-domain-containing protein n=1 Tax=Mrakia frigida TaxID=29902 RepID=UPI003FCC1A27
MATRRASTRVSNGSSSSTHQSPEPAEPSTTKRRAPPSFPALDASEEEVFRSGSKRMRRDASQELPIERLLAASQSSQPPNPPSTSSAQPPPPPPATKSKPKSKGKAKAKAKLSITPFPPPVPSSQTPPSPSSQPLPSAQSTSSSSRGLMLPPPPVSRKPARGRPSFVAKAAKDPDEEDGEEESAGPSVVAKKPRSAKGKVAGSVGREEEVELGLEGGRLMDEMAEEQVKRSKVVGHGAPAFEILSFAPPKPKSSSSSKLFSLPAPPKPSTSHGHSADVSAGDSTVPIQISDTPMIRKNQEMRKNVSKRNSFSQRGARASASFGKGEATTPHAQVDTSSFYKHIDGEEPEAIRMRHLLVFVGKRVASTLASTGSVDGSAGPPPDVKGKGKAKASSSSASRTKDGEIIAAEVMEDVLRMLVKAKVDTNPQSSGSQPFSLPKKPTLPHPGNVQNRKVEAEGERFIKKGRAEEALWSAAVKSANALQTRTCDAIIKKVTSPDWADSLLDDLMDPADVQAAELAKLVLGREGGAEVPEDLEFSIHTMQQITQTAVQVSNESTRLMDSLFANLTQTLRDRDSAGQTSSSHALSSSSNSGPGPSSLLNLPSTSSSASASSFSDPMATLRALANRAAVHPKQETLQAAAALSALGPSGSSSSNSLIPPTTPRRSALPPTTPRRATGSTPFRSGRTPGPAE